jgi:parallel beta-helix repeat protein
MQLFSEIQQLLANADDCDYELPEGDYALIETLVIRGRCRLRAALAAKVKLSGRVPLFRVEEGGVLQLEGVHLEAGSGGGPLVSSLGDFSAWECRFSGSLRISQKIEDFCDSYRLWTSPLHAASQKIEDFCDSYRLWTSPLQAASPAVSLAGGVGKFVDCHFTENRFAGLEVGTNAGATLEGCHFRDNHSFAIRCSGASRTQVRRCQIVDGVGTGLCLTEKSQTDVEDCTFSGNGTAVSWQDDSRGTMRRSACVGGGIGIEVRHRASADIVDCDCSYNGFQGIVAQDDSSPRVRHNLCRNNGQEGIASGQRSRARIHHNQCLFNQSGIAISHSSKSQVHHNHCGFNEAFGIQIGDQAQAQVHDNTCAQNRSGVALFDKASGIVRQNHLENNATGLQICDSVTTLVEGNLCESNRGWGLVVCDAARPRIEHNDLRQNPQPLRVGPNARPLQSGNLTTEWQRFTPSRFGAHTVRPPQAAGPRGAALIEAAPPRVFDLTRPPCAPRVGLRYSSGDYSARESNSAFTMRREPSSQKSRPE